ncbi:hypothetical protein [Lacinutrix chionoecetis]
MGQEIETKITSHKEKDTETIETSHSRALLPLKYYKQKFKKPLTRKDSLNFVYKDNDTLVVIENYKPKGISVFYEYKDSTFLDLYTRVAFKFKNDSLKNEATMKYWKDDISIYFAKEIPKKSKKKFLDFANNVINQVDSLKLKEVKRIEDSNYIIYYSGSFEYESRMEHYTDSDFYMHWNGKNQIYKVALRIKSDDLFNENLRLIEMKRLFFQSLGYFQFNTDLDCSNYFSGCYAESETLSNLDIELLQYHYSYGICKGTDYKSFITQHEKAKEVLREKNIRIVFLHEE